MNKNTKEQFKENAIQTAYCFTRFKYYSGSEAKAIKSLLNRKGMETFSKEEAKEAIELGIKILNETDELAKGMKEKDPQIIANLLNRKFTNSETMLKYAISMLILMPKYR